MALVRLGRACPYVHERASALWLRGYADAPKASTSDSDASASSSGKDDTSPQAPDQRSPMQDEWQEVVDDHTGATYYWNEKTGETTELGDPKPTSRFRNSRDQESYGGEAGPFQEGWREPPEPDKTQLYALIGVVGGIVLGWMTQYMHM